MSITAFRVDWHESEQGWGQRPDGYSFHTTQEAAREYIQSVRSRLPATVPAEYDFPSMGWREPARATPVEIANDSLIGKELAAENSVRVFRTFNGHLGALYSEANQVKVTGTPVEIHYGETPYTPAEQALLDGRRQISSSLDGPEALAASMRLLQTLQS